MDEEGPPDERALLVAGDLRADVKRVDPHPALAQRDANATDGLGQAGPLRLTVDDRRRDPLEQPLQGLELGQVRLAAPRGPQDHQVVVELAEAIPSDQPLGSPGAPIEHPVEGRQLRRGEREGRCQRLGREGASRAHLVQPERERGEPPLPRPVRGRLELEQHRPGRVTDLATLRIQLLFAVGAHRDVEPELEDPAVAPGQLEGQRLGIVGGDLQTRIRDPPVLRVEPQ